MMAPLPSPNRRFPPPWIVEELEECFVVNDSNGQALGYFYFDEEPLRQAVNKQDGMRQRAGRIMAAVIAGIGRAPVRLEVRRHQDRADRAEKWLYQISVEIEQKFLGKDDRRPSRPPAPQPGSGQK
jgi:hypothetical protein